MKIKIKVKQGIETIFFAFWKLLLTNQMPGLGKIRTHIHLSLSLEGTVVKHPKTISVVWKTIIL